MRIALSVSAWHKSERDFDYLQHTYVPYFEAMGYTPLLIPNTISDPAAYALAFDVAGVVLTGGGDVAPDRYHQTNTGSIEISTQRDTTEYRLVEMALDHHLPLFGICRGMQVVNVFFGGGLVQDIPSMLGDRVAHDKRQHDVTLVDARVTGLLGVDHLTVWSYHHQAVTDTHLGTGLDVFARSETDGVVEGVLHRDHPVLAVQWHPERAATASDTDRALIDSVMQRAWW